MKKLFEFTLQKEIETTEEESSKNEKGETVIVKTLVKKKVQQKIFLKRPGRSLYDEAELFYGVKLSEGIKAGLLTRQLLSKRFSNDGGILSDPEKERFTSLYLKAYENQLELEKLSMISEEKRAPEDKSKIAELVKDSANIKEELTKFELGQASLFEQTAENRARNKTILWWTLYLSHFESENGEVTPVFDGANYEDRLNHYDELEEKGDDFSNELIKKLLYYISFWYVGRAQSQEDFQSLIKELDPVEESQAT
jgi:hypothetical protein